MPAAVFHRSPVYYWHPARWRQSIGNQVLQKSVRDLSNRLLYGDAVPPRDSVIFVPPAEVRHLMARSGGSPLPRRRDSARVMAGDWDLALVPVETEDRLVSCRMRYIEGADWEETPRYRRMLDEVGQGEAPDGCRTVEDVKARYAALDRLVAETRARGRLLTREEMPECFRREHGGILLHVARDGSLLRHGGGGHRFAIARVLDLPEMPAQIGAIHREAVANGRLEGLRLTPRFS